MLRPLGSLAQLNELTLQSLRYITPLESPPNGGQALPSVKQLSLTILVEYEDEDEDETEWRVPPFSGGHFLLAIGAWFPSLQHFTLYCPADYMPEIEANRQSLSCTIQLQECIYAAT